MTAADNRKANLVKLAERFGTLDKLAAETGSSDRHLSQMKNGVRKMGDKVARRFEEKLGLPPGWMDERHGQPKARQGSLATDALVKDFEELPQLLQEHVARMAHDLRALVEGVKPEFRNVISAPPSDPKRYAEWENGIRALIAAQKSVPEAKPARKPEPEKTRG